MPGASLYDIAAEFRSIMDGAEDGELTDEQLADIERLEMDLSKKIDGMCGLMAEWESQVAARQAQVDRLAAGIATRRNNTKRLKEWLRSNLELLGIKKHETALWTVRLQNNPMACNYVGCDPESLPERLKKVVPAVVKADTQAALAEFKSTGEVPQGFTVSQGEHLRVS